MVEALLGVVFENLLSLVQNEVATISGIKGKAENLSNILLLIKAVLEDAEEKQVTDRAIKVWLQQLRDAVYVLDDILDECSIESRRLRGLSSFKPKSIIFHRHIGNKFKEITRRFDHIAKSKNNFLLRKGVRERPSEVAEWRQTSSIIAEPKVYGREDDKEKIVEFLLSQERGSDILSIYPIVGLGGMGKTTLAQMVYNDDRNLSIQKEKCDAFDSDVIERKVQELLQGKRYLLVLDDVWKRNQELEFGLSLDKWKRLKSVLSCGSKGPSVLVSTRDKDVAALMGTRQAHHLSGLSDDECWLLFKQYAFGPDKEECANLVAIGKEIVKKCGGLPLAAQALGGLLRSRSEEKEWLEIKQSGLWTLSDENSILPALRLSYFHLTPTLKQCFSFCAIFPKDAEIKKEDLIHLWMANGFISSGVNLEVEDVGNMIWNELCQKSFFQDIRMDYKGDICFKMHDLVHDLAQSVMGSECMILENANMTGLSRSTHHIGFGSAELLSSNDGAFKKVESLRTLYQLKVYNTSFSDCLPTNRSLRVLCINSCKLSSLGSLIHLRYLELDGFDIETFPYSIYSLQKLEVLKLKRFRKLSHLPKHLTCLQNLRHLVIKDCDSLSRLFPNIGKLSCLRTLSVYIVTLETGHTLAELHDLKLGGKLAIQGLENVSTLSEAQEANLIAKKDLKELCLSWYSGIETLATSAEQVLEGLQPHSNLKRLEILDYGGLCFPSWIGFLSSLVALQIKGCRNCVRLSSLGKLPSLKELTLINLYNVQYMDDGESYDGVEVRAFPSLERLQLDGLPNLKWLLKVERQEMFLRLSKLSINNCSKLELPSLPSVKYLSVYGCNNELLRSIYSLYGLTTLQLVGGGDMTMTSFPEGMLRNLTCLQTLEIYYFLKLKELPNELFNLATLESLSICKCDELALIEQSWESLRSLRTMKIAGCEGLSSLPEGIRHLTSLEVLTIEFCPALEERCKEGTGEDWDKIAHIPKLQIK